jgi:2-polyprenyl-6-methoxyphenol hydroxylase-like FAD-dependent oxidoreductase
VGLTAAIELTRRGRRVRIIDRNDGPSIYSKALGINARTLDLLEPSGTSQMLLDAGLKLQKVHMHRGADIFFTMNFAHMRYRFPFLLILPQNKTEAIMVEKLRQMGIEVERNTSFLSLHQDEGEVTVEIQSPLGVTKTPFDYVVAADGAGSVVRQALDLSFSGEAYPENWYLADIEMQWDWSYSEAYFGVHPGAKALAVFPLGGRQFRLISNAKELLEMLPEHAHIEKINWQSTFRISLRQVAHYGKGRVFLAGDAAHIHTPAGGRGMNLGIEDAVSLAGRMTEGGLEDYSRVRHPIGARVVRMSDVMVKALLVRNPVLRFLRDLMMKTVLTIPAVQNLALKNMSGLMSRDP